MEGVKAFLAAVASCGLRYVMLCFCKVEWLWLEKLRERFGGKVTDYNQKGEENEGCVAKK
ncbi:MAG: hypothetical protein Q7U64_13840 [Desulfocapsaceae bacterium]|jgi:hypothetical protein|nr:hypothetical protein [Desulfocapsaceae bacterium]